MSTAVQRKAWNEAMRAAAGASAHLLPSAQTATLKRRSDRRKKQDRRDKARKTTRVSDADDKDQQDYQAAVWIEALEEIDPALAQGILHDDDDEYNVLDEIDDGANDDAQGKAKGAKKGGGKKRSRNATSSSVRGAMPKRLLPRTLGAILIEEANRYPAGSEDTDTTTNTPSTAHAFVDAEARHSTTSKLPCRRKFCPVTGLEGIYTELKSGIPYADLKALEQIRERAPPWMTLGGTPTYWETAKSLRDEEY